ncbi:MAG: hypothetical protein IKM92_04415 [Bacteroidaceae bacterium]|jgi:hypothetical protein|nr:hypothetical protein [Bacteroidaceae bacterium]MBR6845841.1 hypothetical protein [Bacteroidaceae bacterium]
MKRTVIIGTVSLLIIALAGVIAWLLQERKIQEEENKQMVQILEMDKAEMENQYKDFALQYNEMMTQVTNDSLLEQLSRQEKRTQELLEELRQTKANDAAEIMRLKKELETLRRILRDYVVQIDSLNRENQNLRSDNTALRTRNEEAEAHISDLSSKNEQLTDKVNIASQLDATGIRASARNKKGKDCEKVKDAKKLVVSFNISRNVTAQTGMRTIYVRISTPTGETLTRGGSFQFENRQLQYSIAKEIEYTGEEIPVTVYWDIAETLSAGSYHVDIFADGHAIGSTTFSLK